MSYIGNKRQVALYDAYTQAQIDGKLQNYVLKDDIGLVEQDIGDIGEPGTYGFGVGVYDSPGELVDFGLSPMIGVDSKTSESYGNYVHSNGSIVVFVPKFYYRIGNSAHPNYDLFGSNSVEIRGTKYYSTEAEANADGFILHRAFIDGGQEKKGFFYDKYMASQSSSDPNVAVSVRYGVPISLTATTSYTRSATMTGCDGALYDAVTLSRARGTGWNAKTLFMDSAIGLLGLAHAQHAQSSATCAWFDPSYTTCYPKGCNSDQLGDSNDPEVAYVSAGDSGNASKPQTGSGEPFAKTTHNGQPCGIADVNGGLWEVAIGVTQPGGTATDYSTRDNTIYVLNESETFADLTGGWNGSTDIWGDATHLNTKYTSVTAPINLSGQGGWIEWGNGSNPVFFTDQNGVNRALCGVVPPGDSSLSSGGINILGNDGVYRYTRDNLTVRSFGNWYDGPLAGLWARGFNLWRSGSIFATCFRPALYVS